ncbi:hypothetical protein SAMN05519103_00345 [Rhizobiales bacterium GAS113]|nr:hypothetical protein SAMN05519103_00345 [Rhizobiales bacterium GAS113]
MVEPTQPLPNSPGAPPPAPVASPPVPSPVASPSTPPPPTPSADAAPKRPDGLADQYWDDKAGVKVDAVLADLGKFQTDAAARAALVPESPDKYTVALPADFKLPDGWQVNADDPAWKAGREFAHKAGLSQDQFAGLARIYVENQIASAERDNAAIADMVKARDTALGANGPARVDAVNNWFKAAFDQKVADQLSKTLFTPDIVSAFEKIQLALTNQGTQAFRQDGRTQGRSDGKPEGWESWSAIDRRTWDLQQQDAKRQGR